MFRSRKNPSTRKPTSDKTVSPHNKTEDHKSRSSFTEPNQLNNIHLLIEKSVNTINHLATTQTKPRTT
ncbi:hypothetical protein QVD17_11343 [Tagetes erecta]|uniref:Uncharacterized protein n=1 Tax=Tagetes erecta TaxID=13708 RepID=A0AAD8KT92_TARER|nr:hypothetical protein QVD17_11343 [Tagetes erecta]